MEPAGTVVVTGKNGLRGTINTISQPLDTGEQVRVQMDNGQEVLVPANLLDWQEDGSYYLPVSLEQLSQQENRERTTLVVIPVLAEELDIHLKEVETGGVRIHKRVQEVEKVVDQPVFQENIEVERVPMDQILDEPARVRYEGNTMIVPLMEEMLVVEKRLVLKEEVRITKFREEVRKPQSVKVRKEVAEIEPFTINEKGD